MSDFSVDFNVFHHNHRVRIVPYFGLVTEQNTPATPTPQYQGWLHGDLMAGFQMTDSQQTTLSLAFTDKKGNPVPSPLGTVQFLVDIPTLLALTPSADGLSCLVKAVGPLGVAIVTVKDMAADGTTIAVGTVTFTIVAGAVTAIVITPSAPVEQP